jgi:hypothetical protein
MLNKNDIGIKAKADTMNCCDLRGFLTDGLCSCTKITPQLSDTGVERISAGRVIVGFAPDG